jgi:hypothetical protein
MACTNCKKNSSESFKDVYDKTNSFPKGIVIFVITWSGLAIYGLYTIITKFL